MIRAQYTLSAWHLVQWKHLSGEDTRSKRVNKQKVIVNKKSKYNRYYTHLH